MVWPGFETDAIVQEAVEKAKLKMMRDIRVMQEQAWSAGYQACQEGRLEKFNPFASDPAPLCPLSEAGNARHYNNHDEFMAIYNQGPPLVEDLGPGYYRPWVDGITR